MAGHAVQTAQEHLEAGRIAQAVAVLQQHVQRTPRDARGLALLAVVLAAAGQRDRALYAAQRALAMAPDDPEVPQLYAGAMLALGNQEAAESAYRAVLSRDPNRADTVLGLATLLAMRDAHVEVEALCANLLRAHPNAAPASVLLAGARLGRGDAHSALAIADAALELAPEDHDLLFARAGILNSVDTAEPALIAEAHRRIGRAKAAAAGAGGGPMAPLPARNRRGPIRLGLVSSDLRRHPVATFLGPLLQALDRGRVEVVAFNNHTDADEVTARLRTTCAAWHDIHALSDTQASDLIRREHIDVLLDLNGLTAGERLGVFALRPAPVQATWLGYPNTTGLPGMDARLVDALTDPPGSDGYCTERLVRLDGCFVCYGPPTDAPEPAQRPAGAPVVFGSFNALHKLSPSAVALWARIVNQVPGSRLLMKAAALGEEPTRAQVAARFAAAGLPAERLELLGWVATSPLRLYERVDVALDTFPYNGTTTTCEALWMGVPVVAMTGRTHAGRVGTSLLTHAGLGDLVSPDMEHYADLAVALAHDAPRRATLRSALRQRVRSSIADSAAFARRFENALESLLATG